MTHPPRDHVDHCVDPRDVHGDAVSANKITLSETASIAGDATAPTVTVWAPAYVTGGIYKPTAPLSFR